MKMRILKLLLVLSGVSLLVSCSLEKAFFKTDLRRKSYPEGLDTDGDGLTDIQELAMGLDPDNPDTNNNGISDKDEDSDGDGLSNYHEIKLGYDPGNTHTGGTELNDCEKDADGDGAPNCWEIGYGFDPQDPSDTTNDSDQDGFANAEEYPASDPTAAASIPGESPPLVLYDDNKAIAERTNSLTVRGLMKICFPGDQVYLSATNQKPAASDAGFVDCIANEIALTGTLGATNQGSQTMYVWRKNTNGVVEYPVQASVVYDITGPQNGGLSAGASTYNSILLNHTAPTDSDYAAVVLRRFAGASCQTITASQGTGVAMAANATSVTDSGLTTNTAYCYKVFWYDDLDNVTTTTVSPSTLNNPICTPSSQEVWYPNANVAYSFSCDQTVTSVEDSASSWPAYLSLATALPAPGTIIISGTPVAAHAQTNWSVRVNGVTDLNLSTTVLSTTPSFTIGASLDLDDDTLAAIPVSATLDAAYDGSGVDLKPLMGDATTGDTTSNGPVAATETDVPLLSYTDTPGCGDGVSPFVCPAADSYSTPTANADLQLQWNYDRFDQGTYFIQSRARLSVDGSVFYSGVGSTTVTADNSGNEYRPITNDTPIGNANLMPADVWFYYNPAVALNDNLSTAAKQVYATAYTALVSEYRQYSGILTIDRQVSSINPTKTWFNHSSSDDSKLSGNVNTLSLALEGSTASNWIALGGNDAPASSRDLIVSVINGGSTPAVNSTNFTNLGGGGATDGSQFYNVAIAPLFDDSGTSRHGIAFFAKWNVDSSERLYISKINPAGTNEATFLDAASYYKAAGNPIDGSVKSVPVTADENATLSLVKIINATESGTNYFYVAWRDEGDNRLRLARVEASATDNDPEVLPTKSGDELMDFTSDGFIGVPGRPSYGIAAGEDKQGNAIVGVLFSQDDGSGTTTCQFRAYRANSGAGEVEAHTPVLAVSANSDCRFSHLFYNAATAKFMAVYVDGAPNTGDTFYAEFEVDGVSSQLDPVAPVAVLVTNRAAVPCHFAAHYSPAHERIGLVSIEGGCGATAAHDMMFDLYKTPAK